MTCRLVVTIQVSKDDVNVGDALGVKILFKALVPPHDNLAMNVLDGVPVFGGAETVARWDAQYSVQFSTPFGGGTAVRLICRFCMGFRRLRRF